MPKIQDISRSKLIWGFKFLVICLGLAYIILYFNSISKSDFLIFKQFSLLEIFVLMLVLGLLSMGNWFGEFKKWQVLVADISFKTSAKQSLIAHSLALFTPQKLGEYGGKCLFYTKTERSKIMALTAIGHLTQMLATLIFGSLGMLLLFSQVDIEQLLSFKWSWSFLILPLLLLIKPIRQEFKRIINVFRKVDMVLFKRAFYWSLLRYVCFAHQFLILLWIFGIHISYFEGIAAISIVYFIASVLPVFAIADPLVKGSLALTVFGLLGFLDSAILVVVVLMWITNTLFPALLGYIWMCSWRPQLFESKL
jgi:hypothetical protein